jgi:hypothetical protein
MFRIPLTWMVLLLIFCVGLASCGGRGSVGGGGSPSGTGPVVLAMTDTPPTTVSILSAEVMLTGATLSPGNVSLLAAPTTVELTRLQTDVAFLGKTDVSAGSYTSLALTFANLALTIENDTTSAIGTCAIGAICTIAPTTTANLSTTITLPALTVSSTTGAGLLVDVNLENLLSSTLGADFKAGTTVSEFTPAGSGAPAVGAEDVVGQVTTIDMVHNTFALQNATGQFSLSVDNTTSFLQFPSSLCTTSVLACLRANQMLSVDIGIPSDGTAVAHNVLFEDSDSSDTEVEGMIVGIGSQQFTIVTLAESATISGLKIGDTATVLYSSSPQTPFDIDFTHADNNQVSTVGFLFAAPADLAIGQQVQVRRNATTSSGSSIHADRIRLRSSRITASAQSIAAPNIFLGNVPSIFSGHGVTQIQGETSTPTIFTENSNLINISMIPVSGVLSVRGPLFNVSGARTLVATKVVFKP